MRQCIKGGYFSELCPWSGFLIFGGGHMNTEYGEKGKLHDMLQHSIERYAAMHALLKKLAAVISGDKVEVKRLAQELAELRLDIEQEDEALLHLLKEVQQRAPEKLQHNPLMQQRMDIMREVKHMNDLLLPEISGIMTLISHEIRELRGGRSAISGYRPQGRAKSSKRHFTA